MGTLRELRRWKTHWTLFLTLVITISILACGDDATPAQAPAATAAPTSPAPTAGAMATPTQAPAATATPAKPAPTAGATATPRPTLAAQPTATPTPVPGGFPQAGVGNIPASVSKLTVAISSFPGAVIFHPVLTHGINMLQEQISPSLLMRDEDYNIVPQLAVEWTLDEEGFSFTIHPDAIWQDGNPITAEDIKWTFEANRGDYSPPYPKHFNAIDRFTDQVDQVQVIDEKNGFISTKGPAPDFIDYYGGTSLKLVFIGNSKYLSTIGPKEANENPIGGGPYKLKLHREGERAVFERWDDFWGDSDWYHKPQHEELELINATDDAARFALLKSEQADLVESIPFPVAKDLARSEDGTGIGINPGKDELWTQTLTGANSWQIPFLGLMARMYADDLPNPPEADEFIEFEDILVREALDIAIDRQAIAQKVHFGFSDPQKSIWFSGALGFRDELESPGYEPERAKQLLADAGYPDGFKTRIYLASGNPGSKEVLEAVASMWKQIGVDLEIFEIEGGELFARWSVGALELHHRPLALQTWLRQDHSGLLANFGYREGGAYVCCYDENTNRIQDTLKTTTGVPEQEQLLAELEDYIFEKRWIIRLLELSKVHGYTDRVLAHPMPRHKDRMDHLWRVVMRD